MSLGLCMKNCDWNENSVFFLYYFSSSFSYSCSSFSSTLANDIVLKHIRGNSRLTHTHSNSDNFPAQYRNKLLTFYLNGNCREYIQIQNDK